MHPLLALSLVAVVLSATSCQQPSSTLPAGDGPLVVISAPLTTDPWIGRFAERGAQVAVDQLRAAGAGQRKIRLQVLDNNASPSTAVANARTAVAEGAGALITDGTGALAVSRVTDPASLPVFVVYDGGASFVDARTHPTIFRLAPANRYMSRRLADYVAGKTSSVALFRDDSSYGRDGASQLGVDLAHNGVPVVARSILPAAARDVSAQVLAARRAGAKALVLWAGAPDVAQVIRTARSTGWQVPVYIGPSGEDPLVRQQLADHPEWLDGATFVSFRITSEQGPAPFNRFRSSYERRYGADKVGMSADGRPVVQPPDWATYSYDAIMLVAAALAQSHGKVGAPLLTAVQMVSITGANGDQRGFGPDNREGVSSSDMYFARFHHMRFAPVTDDLLSTYLPTVEQ
ncbi:MAG: branched-chain amino acid transport system substrate-binding protein [Pseudonocardiales bacterium]|nr:branched-chain amino acid transport system substrate-binding protein [Pseudonocardiales bacterium]